MIIDAICSGSVPCVIGSLAILLLGWIGFAGYHAFKWKRNRQKVEEEDDVFG